MLKTSFLSIAAAGALALGGCATNHAGEGAIAGGVGGAVIGAVTGGNVVAGAAVGAAAGALVGSLIKKDGHCYRMTRDGREVRVSCE